MAEREGSSVVTPAIGGMRWGWAGIIRQAFVCLHRACLLGCTGFCLPPRRSSMIQGVPCHRKWYCGHSPACASGLGRRAPRRRYSPPQSRLTPGAARAHCRAPASPSSTTAACSTGLCRRLASTASLRAVPRLLTGRTGEGECHTAFGLAPHVIISARWMQRRKPGHMLQTLTLGNVTHTLLFVYHVLG